MAGKLPAINYALIFPENILLTFFHEYEYNFYFFPYLRKLL